MTRFVPFSRKRLRGWALRNIFLFVLAAESRIQLLRASTNFQCRPSQPAASPASKNSQVGLNPTLKRPEQIERYFEVPILADVSGEGNEASHLFSR